MLNPKVLTPEQLASLPVDACYQRLLDMNRMAEGGDFDFSYGEYLSLEHRVFRQRMARDWVAHRDALLYCTACGVAYARTELEWVTMTYRIVPLNDRRPSTLVNRCARCRKEGSDGEESE